MCICLHTSTITSTLTSPAPGDVGLDEQRPPEASKYSQEDEGGQLHQVPRGVKLHVEQHQAAVPKRVDGAQSEGRYQGGEERTPEGLQREVITHLKEEETEKRQGEKGHHKIIKLVFFANINVCESEYLFHE